MSATSRLMALLLAFVFSGSACGQAGPDDRITPPPGTETSEVARLIDQAKEAFGGGKSTSDILADKTYLPVHAYPRFRELIRQHAKAGTLRLTTAEEAGEPLHVKGVVKDANGGAVAGTLIYLYHTSSKGWYSDQAAHISGNGGDNNHARLFGYLKTDGEGKFDIVSIRPAGYPRTDLPAHIHVVIEVPGKPEHWTEIQFEDDPRLTPKWRKESKEAGFVICPVKKDERGVHQVVAEFRLKG